MGGTIPLKSAIHVSIIDLSSYNSCLSKKKANISNILNIKKYSDETYYDVYHGLLYVKV